MKTLFLAVVFCLIGLISSLSACKDTMPKDACEGLKSTSKCMLSDVRDLCPLTCNKCQSDVSVKTDVKPATCVNQLPESDCQTLKSSGRCILSTVKTLCPVQCGGCSSSGSDSTCRNDLPGSVCEALSLTGNCVYKDIRAICSEECGVCNGTITLDEHSSPLPTRNPTQTCKNEVPGFICTDLDIQGKCHMCAVQAICPKKCGACAGTNSTCLTSEIPQTKECVDTSTICKAMAGSCHSDPMVASSCRVTCGLCPTTTIAPTTTVTTTTPAGPPRKCQQCGTLGKPCSGMELAFKRIKECPSDEQFCMADVTIVNGKRNIYKRCANYQTCKTDWYEATSDESSCVNYDPNDDSITSLTCSFCCTKDGCNTKYIPDKEYLYTEF